MEKLRFSAALLSLAIGLIIMAIKFYVYKITNSAAILSDALESVVNVVAAGFALFAVHAAQAPPDENHPYGHGKIEFVTAVFEGGLISFAALIIAYEAVQRLFSGAIIPNLEHGLSWILLASVMNGALGVFLIKVGKKSHSIALEADGKHVLSDFYTSIGVILGLALVKVTELPWLDPAIALLMAVILAFTGIPLVKNAIGGLLDAADEKLLDQLLMAMEKYRMPGLIRVHHVRAMRNGRRIHVDGHAVLPEFWSVERAHDATADFEKRVVRDLFSEGEIEFHVDPCRRAYCKACDITPCPIRAEEFHHRPPMTIAEITSPIDITDRNR